MQTRLEDYRNWEVDSLVHCIVVSLLFSEIAFVAVTEWGGAIAKLWLNVIENLRPISKEKYLFYLSGRERGAFGKE